MIRKVVFLFFVLLHFCSFGQNHRIAIEEVNSVESAKLYAQRFNDVSFTIVNFESDIFLFDEVDTSNLEVSVGKTTTLLGRSTKFIKDTIVVMVELRAIVFDLSITSKDMAEVLLSQMQKRLDRGETFWDLKKKYSHTSALFISGPLTKEAANKKYGIELSTAVNGREYSIDQPGKQIGLVIVVKTPHAVPGFCTISYNAIQ